MTAKVKNLSNATIKLIEFPQPSKKGYPLKVRIIQNRKSNNHSPKRNNRNI